MDSNVKSQIFLRKEIIPSILDVWYFENPPPHRINDTYTLRSLLSKFTNEESHVHFRTMEQSRFLKDQINLHIELIFEDLQEVGDLIDQQITYQELNDIFQRIDLERFNERKAILDFLGIFLEKYRCKYSFHNHVTLLDCTYLQNFSSTEYELTIFQRKFLRRTYPISDYLGLLGFLEGLEIEIFGKSKLRVNMEYENFYKDQINKEKYNLFLDKVIRSVKERISLFRFAPNFQELQEEYFLKTQNKFKNENLSSDILNPEQVEKQISPENLEKYQNAWKVFNDILDNLKNNYFVLDSDFKEFLDILSKYAIGSGDEIPERSFRLRSGSFTRFGKNLNDVQKSLYESYSKERYLSKHHQLLTIIRTIQDFKSLPNKKLIDAIQK